MTSTKLLNEVIAMPGVGYPITRGDCYTAMIDMGHDAKTAGEFALLGGRKVAAQPHANARAAFICWCSDRPADGAALIALCDAA